MNIGWFATPKVPGTLSESEKDKSSRDTNRMEITIKNEKDK